MKNIHIIPTSQPSKIYTCENELHFNNKAFYGDTTQNIYITNDEEIKEGDYGLVVNEILSYNKMIELWGVTQGWKIILTIDQDLIEVGVQPIPNSFLEWLIDNPSCEKVQVNTIDEKVDNRYKIIILNEKITPLDLQEFLNKKMTTQEKAIELVEDLGVSHAIYVTEEILTILKDWEGTELAQKDWTEIQKIIRSNPLPNNIDYDIPYDNKQKSKLLEVLAEIVRISDRKHTVWDRAKELIKNSKTEQLQILKQQQELRNLLFVRPYDIIQIEKKAIILCDLVFDMYSNEAE